MESSLQSIQNLVCNGLVALNGGVALSLIHISGRLTLTATLTIVLLAADFFLPLRLLGSYFHIAMNGAA